ncbi:MAG TPA: hypothetical protein VFZ03_15690, partial [Dongiaceae bacterium]
MTQRGNDRQATFFSDDDRVLYLGWLLAAAREYGCAIHCYVLMTSHVHLLLTPTRAGARAAEESAPARAEPVLGPREARTRGLGRGDGKRRKPERSRQFCAGAL